VLGSPKACASCCSLDTNEKPLMSSGAPSGFHNVSTDDGKLFNIELKIIGERIWVHS
jgi:hypothetical protein